MNVVTPKEWRVYDRFWFYEPFETWTEAMNAVKRWVSTAPAIMLPFSLKGSAVRSNHETWRRKYNGLC